MSSLPCEILVTAFKTFITRIDAPVVDHAPIVDLNRKITTMIEFFPSLSQFGVLNWSSSFTLALFVRKFYSRYTSPFNKKTLQVLLLSRFPRSRDDIYLST